VTGGGTDRGGPGTGGNIPFGGYSELGEGGGRGANGPGGGTGALGGSGDGTVIGGTVAVVTATAYCCVICSGEVSEYGDSDEDIGIDDVVSILFGVSCNPVGDPEDA
jgi:hypothetical protein